MQEYPLSFFRARISKEPLTYKDMWHIPFKQRSKVSTERFSMPGIPCLYLATSSYGCWLEMNKPPYDEFWVSSFLPINNKMKILNLCVQQHQINGVCAINHVIDENI